MTKVQNITILCPTEMEAMAVSATVSHYGAKVMVSGVGTAETAANLTRLQGTGDLNSPVILAGIGGAYPGSGLAVGDCALALSETMADLGAVRNGEFVPLFQKTYNCPFAENIKSIPATRFATVNCISGVGVKVQDYGIENMEGAAFFAVISALGIPFLELRAVSNMTTDSRDKWQIPLALEALAKGLGTILEELKRQ